MRARLALTDTQRFLVLAILIGIFSGLLVVCFHIAIDFVSWYSTGLARWIPFARVLSPLAGAAISTLLVMHLFPAARGSGVNQTKAALYISDGYVSASTIPGKFLACSIAIGSGNSMGPEDPALQMGAGIASLLGRVFRIGRKHMRLIAPVGAAAGIAAAFNTPITGVLFVMEEVVAGWNAGVVGSIVLSAVSAVVVERWFLGNQPLFRVPVFELTHVSELGVYVVLGVAGGASAALWVTVMEHLRERLEALPRSTELLRAALAGLCVGVIGIWLPDVMGAGYESIDSALHDHFAWKLLLILAGVKMLATLLCFAGGVPGGMFAPTIFVGAMLGGGLGALAHQYWPAPTSPAGAYVLVGIGTFFCGVFRAPMTSIFMTFEISASYTIILPVMVANTVAYFISRKLHPVAFFSMLAAQEGVALPSAEEYRSIELLRVEDVPLRPNPPLVDALSPAGHVRDLLDREGAPMALARTRDGWSAVRRSDLDALADADQPLANAVSLGYVPVVYPDLPLDSALRLLGAHPVLPVGDRSHPGKLGGSLTLEDVERAYGIQRRQA